MIRLGISLQFLMNGMSDPTGVEDPGPLRESGFSLASRPHPVRGSTTIDFMLPGSGDVALRLYDVAGRFRETLFHGKLPGGAHRVQWDARGVPAGVYFYRLEMEGQAESRRLVVAE
jgi:hypothetical protein